MPVVTARSCHGDSAMIPDGPGLARGWGRARHGGLSHICRLLPLTLRHSHWQPEAAAALAVAAQAGDS